MSCGRGWGSSPPSRARQPPMENTDRDETSMTTFQKEITTADGEKITLERNTDNAADVVSFRAQGWTEKEQPTLPTPPASTQPRRD